MSNIESVYSARRHGELSPLPLDVSQNNRFSNEVCDFSASVCRNHPTKPGDGAPRSRNT